MGDEVALRASSDDCHLHTWSAQRDQSLLQHQLFTDTWPAEYGNFAKWHDAGIEASVSSSGCTARRGLGFHFGLGCRCRVAGHAGTDDHRLLEIIFIPGRVVIHVLQFMLANLDHIAIFQRMLFDQFAIDERAVGTLEIFKERIIQNGNYRSVLTANREIIDLNVILGLAS